MILDDGLPAIKKSKIRKEIEDLLADKGLVMEKNISALDLDCGDAHHFDDWAELMTFLKGRKGRWYITTPGLRRAKDLPEKR
ncbi:MAG: hypothetical protein QUS07_07995 [Methanothrix sp.]|nr:hypothetical protein [Methanothrix sp.]